MSILQLPLELTSYILSLTDPQTLTQFAKVSRSCRERCFDSHIWKQFCKAVLKENECSNWDNPRLCYQEYLFLERKTAELSKFNEAYQLAKIKIALKHPFFCLSSEYIATRVVAMMEGISFSIRSDFNSPFFEGELSPFKLRTSSARLNFRRHYRRMDRPVTEESVLAWHQEVLETNNKLLLSYFLKKENRIAFANKLKF